MIARSPIQTAQNRALAERIIRSLEATTPAAVAAFCRRYVSNLAVRPLLTCGTLCVRKGSDGYLPAEGDAPFMILIDQDLPSEEQAWTLLHEFFHAQLLIAGVAREFHDEAGIEESVKTALTNSPDLTQALEGLIAEYRVKGIT